MKIYQKLNITAVIVIAIVGLTIAFAGLSTINQVSAKYNKEVMAREIDNIMADITSAHQILIDNRLDSIESYIRQAQSEIVKDLEEYSFKESGQITIYTEEGDIVLHAASSSHSLPEKHDFSSMLQQQHGYLEKVNNGTDEYFISFRTYPQWDWLVVLSISSTEVFAERSAFLKRVIFILLITLLLGSFVIIWVTNKIIGPIKQLVTATAFVSEGKWDTPLPESASKDEISQLTRSFKQMAANLKQMYGDLNLQMQELAESETALKESENRYRSVFENTGTGMVLIEDDLTIIMINASFEQLTGYTSKEVVGKMKWVDFLAQEEKERFLEFLHAGTTNTSWELESTLLDRHGISVKVIAKSQIIPGRQIGVISILDITDREVLEMELRSAQEFSSTILNNIADPIFVKDRKHNWVLLNEAFCKFVGYSREELLGKSDYDFFPKEQADVFWQKDELVYTTGEPNENEEVITDSAGRKHVILTKKAVFHDSKMGVILVGIIKDITDRKKMEQELIKIEMLNSIGILAGGVAHDFNNLLMGIQGRVSLIKGNPDTQQNILADLEAIEEYTKSASNLTGQLLGIAKGGKYEVKPHDINEMIKDSSLMFGRTRKELIIKTTFTLQPAIVNVDRRQIEQVLLNMYVNAWQAMPEGGELHLATTRKTIHRHERENSAMAPGDYVEISVTDSGKGIDDLTQQRIFDPFFTTKEKSRGTGLGLASAYGIIKNHRGMILVESKVDHGTTFKIYLPLSSDELEQEPLTPDKIIRGSEKVLLIDDEEMILKVGSEMLNVLGYNVATATSGSAALEKLAEDADYHLIILDMVMPEMDGPTTFRSIRQAYPTIPVVLSSGYSSDGVAQELLRNGCEGFIQKPFSLSEISQKIRSVLDMQRT